MFKFHPDRLDDETLLGKGNSGEVFPYQKNPQDKSWAVKRILAKNIDELINCLPEIVLGSTCDHPCVVPIKGYSIEKFPNLKNHFHVFLKIPRMKESLLKNFQDRKGGNIPFTENEIIQHFYSLTCGLNYLHSKGIYHRDIRPGNLLLDEQGNLKIADVGIAKYVEEDDFFYPITGQRGIIFYTAPDILGETAKKNQLSKADVWSLGVVILELCNFDYGILNSALPEDRLQNKVNEIVASLEGKFSSELIALVKRLLNLDPEARPSIEQIKDELEESFGESLEGLLNFERSQFYCQSKMLRERIKEISEGSNIWKYLSGPLAFQVEEYKSLQIRSSGDKFQVSDLNQNKNYEFNLQKALQISQNWSPWHGSERILEGLKFDERNSMIREIQHENRLLRDIVWDEREAFTSLTLSHEKTRQELSSEREAFTSLTLSHEKTQQELLNEREMLASLRLSHEKTSQEPP